MSEVVSSALQPVIEHEDFWLFDKPAGISCHDDPETGEMGFFRLLRDALRQPVYPVHRLDKVTSGLLIVARHSEAAATFGVLFEQRRIAKYYLAISDRKPKKKQGWVIGDMLRSRRSSWRLSSGRSNPAVSQFFSYALVPGRRLFLVKPHTGKTHQIRVALKSLGAPILGDSLYAGTPAERTYLHAYAVEFPWRDGLQRHILPASSGPDFTQDSVAETLSRLGCPWHLCWAVRHGH